MLREILFVLHFVLKIKYNMQIRSLNVHPYKILKLQIFWGDHNVSNDHVEFWFEYT